MSIVWSQEAANFPRDRVTRPPSELAESERRKEADVVKTIVITSPGGFLKGPCQLTVGIDHPVDHQKEHITLWLLPMMKREEEHRLVVGETILHPDKSWKLNLSATPQRAGSKVFLSWNSGRKRRVDWRFEETRFGVEIRD
ncbi:hypothetical protein AVEN_13010-1 [Araneus ventricosus]|uniref:Uncharacterized protein n=1 Tax=Araneus ventricosus TaxID=182803 RepID=A0A4Y2HLY9_ARAVE|nr:hypothetical protein AVEN_13010-1 [Araneus ventricosus]